jgi:hypothetical protein
LQIRRDYRLDSKKISWKVSAVALVFTDLFGLLRRQKSNEGGRKLVANQPEAGVYVPA